MNILELDFVPSQLKPVNSFTLLALEYFLHLSLVHLQWRYFRLGFFSFIKYLQTISFFLLGEHFVRDGEMSLYAVTE